ncbi:MAG: 2-keto-4-pentenoate hydratase [Sphingobium sp.]|nr:2-keto-4-pentenoate hydratase [Sphingobium sp.]
MDASGDQVAQAFVEARRRAEALSDFPGERPRDLAQAYRIQDRAITLDGRSVVGWKVGRINPPLDAQLGRNRLAGPTFADTVVSGENGVEPAMPIYAEGFAAVEAEFMLHVREGWKDAPDDPTAAAALVDDVRIGLEIASSPYPGINSDGPLVTISDFGNNSGLVLGPRIDDWAARDLNAIMVTMIVDGVQIGQATAASMLDGPFGAVCFLLGNLAERGVDVGAPLWISTGAVTGVHEVTLGQRAGAFFDGIGSVRCRIGEMTPR